MLLFDIGANIGKYALANQGPNTTIVSVEPTVATFNALRKNVQHVPTIHCENYAVSDTKEDSVTFFECESNTINTLNSAWLLSGESRFAGVRGVCQTKVPTITLDALIQKYGVPDHIKIDVEGAEDIVVRSLSQKVERLSFEWAAELRNVAAGTLEHLSSLGFSRFYVEINSDSYTFTPQTYPMTREDVITFLEGARNKYHWGMIHCV